MKTYTIAYLGDTMLLLTALDGTPREQMLATIAQDAGEAFNADAVTFEHGLTLTEDEPEDADRIAWASEWNMGFILDEERRDYAYAVRPAPAEDDEREPGLCLSCSGSGEGQHEGTSCWTCDSKGAH